MVIYVHLHNHHYSPKTNSNRHCGEISYLAHSQFANIECLYNVNTKIRICPHFVVSENFYAQGSYWIFAKKIFSTKMKKKNKPTDKPGSESSSVSSKNMDENIKFIKKLELQQAILNKLVKPNLQPDTDKNNKE